MMVAVIEGLLERSESRVDEMFITARVRVVVEMTMFRTVGQVEALLKECS